MHNTHLPFFSFHVGGEPHHPLALCFILATVRESGEYEGRRSAGDDACGELPELGFGGSGASMRICCTSITSEDGIQSGLRSALDRLVGRYPQVMA